MQSAVTVPLEHAPAGIASMAGCLFPTSPRRTSIDSPETAPAAGPLGQFSGRRVHLIGIGGCGMSGAAAMLSTAGAIVSGSDQSVFAGMGQLVERGVRVTIGHDASHMRDDVELVLITAAIPPTNVELIAARQRGLCVLKYAEFVGLIMDGFRGVAVAGTHGKSTTTALSAHLFREAGLSPSFIVGARSHQLGGSSGLGSGPHLIVESCEFNRSFLHFHPEMAAVLNVETDHVDCFSSLEEIIEAFAEFMGNVRPGGLLLCNGDDRFAMEAAQTAGRPIQTFGLNPDADWRAVGLSAERGRFSFEVEYRRNPMLSARLSKPGLHNVMNALAAIALAHRAGATPEQISAALPDFKGINRRMTYCGTPGGVTIVDDYAHHPTEIRVTIEAMRDWYEPKRLWVVFQPHQQARTDYFLEDFAISLARADEVVVPDVYAVREASAARVHASSEALATRIRSHGTNARYLPELADAAEHVLRSAAAGDLVLTLGAGDVWRVADELVQRIR